jgi:phosphatidylserine/phosphatidylglycerophosphate/cardiolipin synthase-like enzyme
LSSEDTSPQISLHTDRDYFAALHHSISELRQGGRLAILTMGFDPRDTRAELILSAMAAAARRGVSVYLGVDAFGLLAPRTVGPFVLPLPCGRAQYLARVSAIENLASLPSVTAAVLNYSTAHVANFFANRCHIRLAVADDRVYLAGPSLEETNRVDLAVTFVDRPISDVLVQTVARLLQEGTTRRALPTLARLPLSPSTDVIIDGGLPRESGLRDACVATIEQARDWIVVGSQYLPNGRVAEALTSAAARGIDLHVAYNPPYLQDGLNWIHRLIEFVELRRRPPVFFLHRPSGGGRAFHMTALATESTGVVTTMNFIDVGVRWGTAEIGLVARDSDFAMRLRDAIVHAS